MAVASRKEKPPVEAELIKPQHDEREAEESGSPEDRFAAFESITSRLDLTFLPAWALSFRRGDSVSSLSCTVISPPLFGSFNIAYPLHFSDGVKWIVKIPQSGHPKAYDDTIAQALQSEAYTMRLIGRETTIPVPEVITLDPSLEKSLRCPYILMGFIEGKALGEVWHDKVSGLSDVEERRSTALKDIAKAILQLNKFTFTEGGRPEYSNDGRLMRIGAARQFDMHAIMEGTDQDKDTESLPQAYSGLFKKQFSYLLSLWNKKCQRPSDGA
ncbi:hypothetical protein LTS18_014535 [Coniosporium uncinatum]|uniref:Uncharacterized protein n=1 Tax=Coniosporium uncinatum TaxID=93489 RepID=A0ACC3D8K3_9PEZI|nr:hypothetical protein LTS18_014535 [Coniosporium uncinatum]